MTGTLLSTRPAGASSGHGASMPIHSKRPLSWSRAGSRPLDNEEVVARIYEAAAIPELWPELLDVLAREVGAKGGTLGRYETANSGMIYSAGVAELVAGWVAGGYHLDNRRGAPLHHSEYPGFLTDDQIHSEEARRTMPCYAEFLVPNGADRGAATRVPGAGGETLVMTVECFPDGTMQRAAIPRLDALRPHLARAAVLAAELQLREVRAAVEALERSGAGAAMLGHRGQVLAANGRFFGGLGLHARDGRDRLRFAHRAADCAFAAAMATIATGQGCSVAIRDELGVGYAALHLVPVQGAAHDLFAGASAIALVARPGQGSVPSAELIRNLFDLTPTEASVARSIAEGSSVDEVARLAGKSVETVRSHLKRVFSKTGTGRQNELAVLLAGLAAPSS